MQSTLFSNLKFHHMILIAGATGIFGSIVFGFILYTPALKYLVNMQKALKPGHEVRDLYLKIPFPLDFRVYFFNITNPDAVKNGAKPIVKEIGPYCYDAFKEKINVEDDVANDTLTYTPYETYFFNTTRSGKLSQDDHVTILNPLVVGVLNAVLDEKPGFIVPVSKALQIILKDMYDMYVTIKVRDLLFDGITIDCNVKDFSAKAVCSQLKGQPVIVADPNIPNLYRFSMFGTRNGTIPKRITVYRGIKNASEIGRVVRIDQQTDLQVWPEKQCNDYQGTDGWIFPSFLGKEDGIWTLAYDLCRNFKARYVGDLTYNGVSVRKYYADMGDSSANPDEKCFCPASGKCWPKGVYDLSKCLKVPLLSTLPHFLFADKSLLKQVEGLHPNEEKHVILIYFEPTIGTPMLGQRRIQFNLQVSPIDKVDLMKSVTSSLHPVLWLEEGAVLEGYILQKIITVSTLLKVGTGCRYASLILSIEFVIYGCYQIFKEWQSSKVSPLEPKTVSGASNKTKISLQPEDNGLHQNGIKNGEGKNKLGE